jgi:hypothetical protein
MSDFSKGLLDMCTRRASGLDQATFCGQRGRITDDEHSDTQYIFFEFSTLADGSGVRASFSFFKKILSTEVMSIDHCVPYRFLTS